MATRPVSGPVSLRLPQAMMVKLDGHLFPGDGDEHGAVIAAAVVETGRGLRLLGRRLFLAVDGTDYVPGQRSDRMLTAEFVRLCALACAGEGLAYLAVHNHGGTNNVSFSAVDMASHRRGYPALVDILDGPPVGALVFARRAIAGDIWLTAERHMTLDHAVVVGRSQQLLHPSPQRPRGAEPQYDRQVRLLGERGQDILATQKVGVIGAGGAGSLVNEYLARLGIGHLVIVDFDRLDLTNCPRVIGARRSDLGPRWLPRPLARLLRRQAALKVDIAERVAREANPSIRFEAIAGDVTDPAVIQHLIDCDAIFLAADSMQARLVVNALCHQYLISTWQVGAKVQVERSSGDIEDVFSVVRQLVPGQACLWCNQLVNPARLAEEAASPQQRSAQRYVEEVLSPSVITLNAVAAAHAVNDYLFAALDLRNVDQEPLWSKFRPLDPDPAIEIPRSDPVCTECAGRIGAGPRQRLPVRSLGERRANMPLAVVRGLRRRLNAYADRAVELVREPQQRDVRAVRPGR